MTYKDILEMTQNPATFATVIGNQNIVILNELESNGKFLVDLSSRNITLRHEIEISGEEATEEEKERCRREIVASIVLHAFFPWNQHAV